MNNIKVSDYCNQYGLSEAAVIERIRNGDIKGAAKMGIWYVDIDDSGSFIEVEEKDKVELLSEEKTKKKPQVVRSSEDFRVSNYRAPKASIKLSTLDYISGKSIQEIDLVSVSSVQSVNLFKSFGAEIRSSTIGGKSKSISALFEKSREELLDDLRDKAYSMKADAVIGIRFSSGEVLQTGLELMAYGTAVKVSG